MSLGRSPILEKLLSTDNQSATSSANSLEPNPGGMDRYSELPYPFPRIDQETLYFEDWTHLDQNFASEETSPGKQCASYTVDFINENRTEPRVIWCKDDDFPISSLSSETSIFNDPNFLLNFQEPAPSCTMASQLGLTEELKPFHTNLQVENNSSLWQNQPSYSSRQPPYNRPTTHRLRHFPIPYFCPYEQDYYSVPSNQRPFHFDPYSSRTEESKMVLPYNYFDPNFALPLIPDYYNQPKIHDDSIPMQALPHFCPQNLMPQSHFNPQQIETRTNTQICNDYHLTSNLLNKFNEKDFHQLIHKCPNTRDNSENGPLSTRNTIPGNQEYPKNSMNADISGTQPSSHQPVSFNVKLRKRTSCIYEGDLKAFGPRVFEQPETGTIAKKREQTFSREACLSEGLKQLSGNSGKVTSKRGSRSCPVCDRQLARTSTLKIHLRQHSGDRPFKCDLCPKSFAQTSSLKSHHRTHSGERPYACSRCHKRFVHSSALKTHARTHTGERPHRCPVPTCNMAFADSSSLSKHARVHSGKRPYLCDVCGRRFTQSGNMHKHRRSVHKETNVSR